MDAERPGMNYSICSTHLNLTMVSFHIDTVIKLLGYFVVVFGFFFVFLPIKVYSRCDG